MSSSPMVEEAAHAATSLFPGAHRMAFQGPAGFHTAGRDMWYMPTYLLSSATQTWGTRARSESPLERTQIIEPQQAVASSPLQAGQGQHPESSSQAAMTASAVANPPGPDGINILKAEDHASELSRFTKAEIYVRSMLVEGKGLACWHPEPRKPYAGKRGVAPGDVGTYSACGGFEKIFNLWEDDHVLREADDSGREYSPPSDEIVVHEEEYSLEDTVVQGTDSAIEYTPDGDLAAYKFRCLSAQGAVLALTSSPADLEKLANPHKLQHFLIDHAALLFGHADSIRTLDDSESLYVITGCIKTDGWAIAAFKDPPHPTNDVLKLVKRDGSGFAWTSRATAATRTGPKKCGARGGDAPGAKDQSLFLQGFKLALSPEFRSQARGKYSQSRKASDPEDKSQDPSNAHQGEDGSGRGSGTSDRDGRGGDRTNGLPKINGSPNDNGKGHSETLAVENFPNMKNEATLHPCDIINKYLLERTGEHCALSHDDDWMFLPDCRGLPSNVNIWQSDAFVNYLDDAEVTVVNGIAILTQFEDPEDWALDLTSEPDALDDISATEIANFLNLDLIDCAVNLTSECYPEIEASSFYLGYFEPEAPLDDGYFASKIHGKPSPIVNGPFRSSPRSMSEGTHESSRWSSSLSTAVSIGGRTGSSERKMSNYVCARCGRLFEVSGQLERHIWACNGPVVPGTEDARFRDDASTSNGSSLPPSPAVGYGRASRSIREAKFACDIWRQSLASKWKDYPCSSCGNTFTTASVLTKHLKVRRPMIVDRPEREIATTIDPRHLQQVTSAQQTTHHRKFCCDSCHQIFPAEQELKNHKRIHEGIKTHTCSGCGTSFSTARTMFRHLKVCDAMIENHPEEKGHETPTRVDPPSQAQKQDHQQRVMDTWLFAGPPEEFT